MTTTIPENALIGYVAHRLAMIAIAVGLECTDLTERTTIRKAREAIRSTGIDPAPVGVGNGKVGTVSTYRGIDETCPRSCPLFRDCYASEGNVNLHQLRAGGSVRRSLGSFAIGIALWVSGHASAIRLHTSGDFGSQPDTELPDVDYVDGLSIMADTVISELKTVVDGIQASDRSTIAWSYTHLPDTPERAEMIAQLRECGIEVLVSDAVAAGGAIVMPHAMIPTLKRALRVQGIDAHPIACPEQAAKRHGREVTCAQCQLCWVGCTEKRRLIVFDPIGGEASKASQGRWEAAAPLAHILRGTT